MKELKDALDFARSSAVDAFDQVKDYKDIYDAVRSYRKNVTDTMREYNAMFNEPMALESFDAEVKIQNRKYELMPFEVVYQRLGNPKSYTARFENVEDARLWWDSIAYLRNAYFVASSRP